MNADSRLRRDFNLWSDSRLQTRKDSKLQTTASGVIPDYKLRCDYRLRSESELPTPEWMQTTDSGVTPDSGP